MVFLAPSISGGLLLWLHFLLSFNLMGNCRLEEPSTPQQSQFTITEIELSRKLSPEFGALQKTDFFYPDEELIVASVTYQGNTQTVLLEVKWENTDTGVVIEKNTYTIKNQQGSASYKIKKPLSGWPTGNYKVSFLVSNLPIKTLEFKVSPSPKQSEF